MRENRHVSRKGGLSGRAAVRWSKGRNSREGHENCAQDLKPH